LPGSSLPLRLVRLTGSIGWGIGVLVLAARVVGLREIADVLRAVTSRLTRRRDR
jgi:hypothetical protein